jgi:beta-lysine 5,6-aminomutase alpha subunit
MPPTKHMTGNVFGGFLLDAFFNLAGVMTGQSILLVGMMTEGIHTPFLSDRDLALENVRYVAAGRRAGWARTSRHRPGGFVQQRAQHVLAEAVEPAAPHRQRRAAQRDRRRDVRHHPAARRRRGRAWRACSSGRKGYFNPAAEFLEDPATAGKGGSHEAAR